MANIIERVRAWIRRREQGSIDPSEVDSYRQDAQGMAHSLPPGGQASFGAPPNYVHDDDGRPRK